MSDIRHVVVMCLKQLLQGKLASGTKNRMKLFGKLFSWQSLEIEFFFLRKLNLNKLFYVDASLYPIKISICVKWAVNFSVRQLS